MKNSKLGKSRIGEAVIELQSDKQASFETALLRNVKEKEEKGSKKEMKLKPGVILLNHIPFGFFEKELRGFFSQFGKVLRVRVARSEKTGKSKGYAFIEFEFEDVAKIAAESMDGYLMFERLMKCEVLPQSVNTYKVFSKRYISEKNYPKLKSRMLVKSLQQSPQSPEQISKLKQLRLRKLEDHNRKLFENGIEYEFSTPLVSTL